MERGLHLARHFHGHQGVNAQVGGNSTGAAGHCRRSIVPGVVVWISLFSVLLSLSTVWQVGAGDVSCFSSWLSSSSIFFCSDLRYPFFGPRGGQLSRTMHCTPDVAHAVH